MSTLASLAATALVGKKIDGSIPSECQGLIDKQEWLRSTTTVYYIPISYHPVSDELMEEIREEFEKPYGCGRGSKFSDFEFNKPVPKDYDFRTPIKGTGISDYDCNDKFCNPIIQLLQGHGVILKRGDIVRCEMFMNDGILGSFIVDIVDIGTSGTVDIGTSGTVNEKVTLHDCTLGVDLFRTPSQFKVLIDHPPMYFSSAFEQGFLTLDLDMFFEEIYASLTPIDGYDMIRSKITYDDIVYDVIIILKHNFMLMTKESFKVFFEYKIGTAWMYQKLENNDSDEESEEDEEGELEQDRIYEFLKKQDKYTTIIFRIMN